MWQIQDSDSTHSQLTGAWSVAATSWMCQAGGGAAGITLGNRDAAMHLHVGNVGPDELPVAGEQYVRGEAWKIHYPQKNGQYSLRMSLRVVQASSTRIVWEPTFSIQTSLLDTAPSLELTALGDSLNELDGESLAGFAAPAGVGISAIRVPTGGQMMVMMGPQDAPVTKSRSSRTRLDLRIFGEFLEKGVIRKTRPWVIFDTSSAGVSAVELTDYCHQLCQTPLPLTV